MLDAARINHAFSYKAYEFLLINAEIFTSCDIITTLYYIGKKVDKINILQNIINVNKTVKVVEFSNNEVEESCELMMRDGRFVDLEDTLQYIMAKKYDCDLIISNDKEFVNHDTTLMSSKDFLETLSSLQLS